MADDNVPGSEEADICLVAAGSVMPRYGREYDLRNVDRRGNDDKLGSLDSYGAAPSRAVLIDR